MFLRERGITIPVLEIAGGLGMIEHGRRIAQTISTGLCRIEKVGENEYIITCRPSSPTMSIMRGRFQSTTVLSPEDGSLNSCALSVVENWKQTSANCSQSLYTRSKLTLSDTTRTHCWTVIS